MTAAKAKRILFQFEQDILYPAFAEIRKGGEEVEYVIGLHDYKLNDALRVVHEYLKDQVRQAEAAVKLPDPEQ